ncbi:Atg22A-1p [Arthroderma uncinatum]|uniref:Atg22A-1p n=1 Tax=Arthroderma uncinatum TaxID=74035 RepID=UPI00144ACC43|nr:Atg22A-1p [Arthroderma uncinatum]KAF3491132.1 Atg22A-1p [Arthroderma uncinatum]
MSSSTAPVRGQLEDGDGNAPLLPQTDGHPQEDTRPTSRKELAGWYCYGWAAEVFVVCAMGSFLPLALEQMSRDQGVLLSDKKTPCTSTWQHSNATAGARAVSPFKAAPSNNQCIVYMFGFEVNTASFAMYTFSTSVLIQSLIIISISAAADHGAYRKTFLLIFAVVGSIAMMLFLPLSSHLYMLAAFLAIVANTGFGGSFVLLNSFLPLLVRNHPTIRAYKEEQNTPLYSDTHPETNGDLEPSQVRQSHEITPESTTGAPLVSAALELSSKISSNGIGIGYTAAVLVQICCILIVLATHSTTFSLRLVLFIIGMWWFVFTIPAGMWLRPRPGPPLPEHVTNKNSNWPWVDYVVFAWKSLGRTAMRARRLKDVVLFLAAWFLLSDGIATVSGTAVLFAKTQLKMELAALGMINVITMISGVCGAFYWSYVSRLLGLRPSQTIIACICIFEIIPLYGLLGYLPPIQRLGVLGLQQPWEMYPLGAIYGLVIGGLSSYCRSFFGELIPHGFEASFYALYAITDKGSSFFGPAIVGAITDRYGEIRPAFFFLAVLIMIPLPLMMLVDAERGKRDADLLVKELEGSADADDDQGQVYGTTAEQRE